MWREVSVEGGGREVGGRWEECERERGGREEGEREVRKVHTCMDTHILAQGVGIHVPVLLVDIRGARPLIQLSC